MTYPPANKQLSPGTTLLISFNVVYHIIEYNTRGMRISYIYKISDISCLRFVLSVMKRGL